MFGGTLGDWNTEPVSFEMKEGAKPYYGRAFPIPKVHKATILKEIKRLITRCVRVATRIRMGCTLVYTTKEKWNCSFSNRF